MAKTARTILKQCVRSIEATHWCQGDLWLDEFDKEERTGGFGERYRVSIGGAPKKQLGCALGLLAQHGEHGEAQAAVAPDGTTYQAFRPIYPHLGPAASPGLVKAVTAVFEALPKSRRRPYEHGDLGSMDNAIIAFNDAPRTSKAKALAWFQKALEQLA